MHARLVLALVVVAATALGLSATASAATVSKSQRQVVVFVADMSQGSPTERAFYDFVEFGAAALAVPTLGPVYRQVNIVHGAAATRARLVATLKAAAARPGNRAVDLVFVTHGTTDEVVFSGGVSFTMAEVRDAIRNGLTTAERSRLRMVFSTACFGAAHNAFWRSAGFRVVSGGRQIYADSAASYAPFLGSWAAGASFATAVAAANAADPLRVNDNAAKLILGRTDVNSRRVVSGVGSLSIATMP